MISLLIKDDLFSALPSYPIKREYANLLSCLQRWWHPILLSPVGRLSPESPSLLSLPVAQGRPEVQASLRWWLPSWRLWCRQALDGSCLPPRAAQGSGNQAGWGLCYRAWQLQRCDGGRLPLIAAGSPPRAPGLWGYRPGWGTLPPVHEFSCAGPLVS